eukprot:jgi/Mesvir1/28019/Mv04628-RA.1
MSFATSTVGRAAAFGRQSAVSGCPPAAASSEAAFAVRPSQPIKGSTAYFSGNSLAHLRGSCAAKAGVAANGRRMVTQNVAEIKPSSSAEACLVPPMNSSVLGIILGGGAGSRLYPLTKKRAKPAVPLGANYRLIDVPVSNCINSNVRKIYVLTQFNSASLNRHISRAYGSNLTGYNSMGFVEVLAAQQAPDNPEWFQGTADAVRQYLWLFEENESIQDYLILAGDHLYRMDYGFFVQAHRDANADITVAALPMDEKRATAFGLMKIDNTGRIIDFAEKPKGDALKAMQVDTTVLGLDKDKAKAMPYIASMGIYVIKKSAMRELCVNRFPKANDFGSEIIPGAKDIGMKVQAYLYDGYWEDIGTIESFYEANLKLTQQDNPAFSFYDRVAPIYTLSRYLPPSKVLNCKITDSVIGEGCMMENSVIHHSVIGLRSLLNDGCHLDGVLMLGADYYETAEDRAALLAKGDVPIGVGKGSVLKKCIIDKNARIGKNVQIINKDQVEEAQRETDGYYIKNGIIVIMKDAKLVDNTII